VSQAEETQAPENAVRHRKERQGVVVSAKSEKTVVVSVSRRVKHPRYKKYVTRRKRYTAHDLIGCKEGDVVRIRETRPLSKTKRWQVAERIESRA
jgi:small subunit ribosomal protein S17